MKIIFSVLFSYFTDTPFACEPMSVTPDSPFECTVTDLGNASRYFDQMTVKLFNREVVPGFIINGIVFFDVTEDVKISKINLRGTCDLHKEIAGRNGYAEDEVSIFEWTIHCGFISVKIIYNTNIKGLRILVRGRGVFFKYISTVLIDSSEVITLRS